VTKVRQITGGEPLVRKKCVCGVLKKWVNSSGLDSLVITTNGKYKLSNPSTAIETSGIKRVNISVDSLIPERFKTITRHR